MKIIWTFALFCLPFLSLESSPLSEKIAQVITSDEMFAEQKDELRAVWKELISRGLYEVVASDAEARPTFVTLQAVVEHVLACELGGGVSSLMGIIHTPTPTTPLCTRGEISHELVDETIAQDPRRLFTVQARTVTLREFLRKGGILHVVYPKEGLVKRTEEQQAIYREELSQYPHHRVDAPIGLEAIPPKLIGATYLFQDREGELSVFAIKFAQANDPKDGGEFALWFGSANHPAVEGRLKEVGELLSLGGLPPLLHK